MTSIRLGQIERDPWLLGDRFDVDHLRELHKHTLRDVYAWAGEFRTVQTEAMGIEHERTHLVAERTHMILDEMSHTRPSTTDPDLALRTAAHFWAPLTYTHPFVDGNSRTQRAFMQLYLQTAGWDIDWRVVDADAVHAARHASAIITFDGHRDLTWLIAQLEPGIVELGDGTSLAHDSSSHDESRAVRLFMDMLNHAHEHGEPEHTPIELRNDGFTFYAATHPAADDPLREHLDHLHQLEQERLAHEREHRQSPGPTHQQPSHIEPPHHRRGL